MRRFRRWLIRLLVIVVALGALLALTVGLVAERYFPSAVAELDRRLGPWTLQPERFDRGWLSSRLTIKAEDSSGAVAWRYRARLAHGPLPLDPVGLGWIAGRGTLEAAGDLTVAKIDWGLTPGLRLIGRIDLSPPGTPAGEIELSLTERFSRLEFELRGLSYAGTRPVAFDDVDGSGWARIAGARIGGQIDLKGRRLALPGAAIDGPALIASADQQGDLIELRLQASAAHAGLDQSYRDARAVIEVQRLHRPTLEQFATAATRILEAGLPPRMRDRQLADNFLLVVPGLLQHRPRIALEELDLTAPQGQVSAAGAVALAQVPPPGYLSEPARLLPALDAHWDVRVPDGLARQWLGPHLARRGLTPEEIGPATDALLERRRAEGWLIAEDRAWRTRGRLAEGLLDVNGSPRPFPDWTVGER